MYIILDFIMQGKYNCYLPINAIKTFLEYTYICLINAASEFQFMISVCILIVLYLYFDRVRLYAVRRSYMIF